MTEAAVKRPPGRGRFICFEGGAGSGKATQIKTLARHLDAARMRTLLTREPGGTPGADIIRHLLASGIGELLGPDAEALLLAAACDDHVRSVIIPALNQGIWVLCSDFWDATRADLGRPGKVAPGVLNAMERVTIGDIKPDLTIILDVPVEIGLRRAAIARGIGSLQALDAEAIKSRLQLRDAYRQIAAAEPQRCVLIDASVDVSTVAADIWAVLRDRFFARSAGNMVTSA